ncbi:NDP-sugar epimerase, includes UDP-GlcNAc-inverting 4,6-dehydratase FlaA1 and capsular polysaccharide biosynthesis protein EpsC [Allochromatium warmingii]|uniref:NDP-sugar epimerase, includes UDP-GlcNAc-inverting 4,6-dehydratase FlaA1 and capsular polysaccharide biosynthesis protein EpsC n=1 Tax=Allochromatium warmingii TaxID=61595 RepID=A0A1H3IQT3_ALLWA|nr:nucleoside-diphosphate sugar epimerase/dehydratase [Allochromatium warmingii]SDY29629.1 NDP-sugar epimerase, includes UDP-GlcNAc-inverting 4,6-dehydratase FlaA1 and capsular polysaccharide biosynthesis protein EpsC [Allochromatium warmingii]
MIARWLQRARSRLLVFVHDILMIPLAWGLAYWMRFNLAYVPPNFIAEAIATLPLVILIIGPSYWAFGLYRGVWRFASLNDLARIAQAVLVGTMLLLFVLFALNRMAYVPRSLPILFIIFQLILLAGPRLLYRWLKDRRLDFSSGQRVLIVGAGRAGEMLVRDLLRDRQCGYVPVAFVDDTPRRQGGVVHGVPIRGTTADIPHIVERFGIDMVLLAAPSASAVQMQRLVERCERAGRPFRTVPQTKELMAGRVAVNQLRAVSIEDLLGRDPVTLDWAGIQQGLAGRVVLISGAGGSIGSELCRQLAQCGPRQLILVDHSEYNLYRIETELLDQPIPPSLSRYLLDVTQAAALERLFARQRPDVVFHAAAYKHVPLLQDQILAALTNNVMGTRLIAAAADRWGCERFVLISTDKAVNPTNIMGATKRAAELICQDKQTRSSCRFMTVRFGNVLGSAGSVVPRFQQQIARGGPVTVTHPDIERFFMTIPEACQLIMQAAVIGQGGETFVLDMGEPVKIRYLAEQMIRLSGREPGRDIRIEYTGLRPGEKLYEELFYPSEGFTETPHPRIQSVRRTEALDSAELAVILDALSQALQEQDEQQAAELLGRLVPLH